MSCSCDMQITVWTNELLVLLVRQILRPENNVMTPLYDQSQHGIHAQTPMTSEPTCCCWDMNRICC